MSGPSKSLLASLLAAAALAAPTPAAASETRAYAVSWLYPATQQRDDDCGDGLNPFGADLFQIVLKDLGYSKKDADRLLALYPSTPGTPGGVYIPIVTARGRNQENVYQQPESTPDPGLKLVTGRYGPGLDLDGRQGPHSFVDADTGQTGVDNELWRAFGCIQSHRSPPEQIPNFTGAIWDIARDERPAVLIEIAGLDDDRNDPEVEVRIYSSHDVVLRDANGRMRPDKTFRVDPDRRWHNLLPGRIENGVLTTDPVPELSVRGDPYVQSEYRWKDGRVRLELTEDGGLRGVVAGYHAWRPIFWRYGDAGWVVEHAASVNVPGLYYALKRLADAYPDPQTGENTHISSAYRFDAVPALLVHPPARPATAAADVARPAIAADVPALMPDGVVLRQAKGRLALHDAAGRPLYVHAGDAGAGRPSCLGDCAAAWPVFAAADEAKSFGDWAVVTRDDGARQWAWRGQPLYRFAGDEKPGEAAGDGAADGAWRLAAFTPSAGLAAPHGIAVQEVPEAGGLALVDAAGMVLYTAPAPARDKGRGGDAACLTGPGCWAPVAAPGLAGAVGDFLPVDRPDGSRQWAYKGSPLFTYGGDRPGEAAGAGVQGRQVALAARYFLPAEVTLRRDEALGPMLTTKDGRTLYAKDRMGSRNGHHLKRRFFTNLSQTKGPLGCDGACTETWQPLAAPPDARQSDYWRVVPRDDGTRQWAYQGYPLYTHAGDRAPGDATGRDVIDYHGTSNATAWRFVAP